jgi:hypothetical protein
MKLCKDCKHIGKSPFGAITYCTRVVGTGLLDGGPKCVDQHCEIERRDGWFWSRVFKSCGEEGRFFEEKESKCQSK